MEYCKTELVRLIENKAGLEKIEEYINEYPSQISDLQGLNALAAAINMASMETIDLLVKKGVDINKKNKGGKTPLMFAAQYPSVTKHLLSLNADVNAIGKMESTALAIACQFGNLDVIRILLEAGSSINHHDAHKRNGLYYAVKNDYLDVVQLLIDSGALLSSKLLNEVVSIGMFEKLLKCGLIPKSELLKSYLSRTEEFRLLAKYVSEINYRFKNEKTLLCIICDDINFGTYDTKQLLAILLEAGADPNLYGSNAKTPLFYLCERSGEDRHLEEIEIILKAGANPNIQTVMDQSALIVSIHNNSQKTVSLLLQYGADPNEEQLIDLCIKSLMSESKLLNESLVIDLLLHGMNGVSLMEGVIHRQYDQVMITLLERGFDPDTQIGSMGTFREYLVKKSETCRICNEIINKH